VPQLNEIEAIPVMAAAFHHMRGEVVMQLEPPEALALIGLLQLATGSPLLTLAGHQFAGHLIENLTAFFPPHVHSIIEQGVIHP